MTNNDTIWVIVALVAAAIVLVAAIGMRRRARTRIAVGEGPRHRQRHRHLEQRARDFCVRHFRSSFSIPARTSSRMSSRLSA